MALLLLERAILAPRSFSPDLTPVHNFLASHRIQRRGEVGEEGGAEAGRRGEVGEEGEQNSGWRQGTSMVDSYHSTDRNSETQTPCVGRSVRAPNVHHRVLHSMGHQRTQTDKDKRPLSGVCGIQDAVWC